MQQTPVTTQVLHIIERPYGKLDGFQIIEYTLINRENGFAVKLLNYGGIITSISFPDKAKRSTELVLGYDSLEAYISDQLYMGSALGPYANRIRNGSFEIDSEIHQLDLNWKEHHLHGGRNQIGKRIWNAELIKDDDNVGVQLSLLNPETISGYPGDCYIKLKISINTKDELCLTYRGKSTKDTILNLSHHCYFNFNGDQNNNISNHQLRIYANSFTPFDEDCLPTGEIKTLGASSLDFSTHRNLGDAIKANNGIDNNFVINDSISQKICAQLTNPDNGIRMALFSTMPGLQIYSGDYVKNIKGRNNDLYSSNAGICLEPQYFPDSPNNEHFLSPILHKDEEYNHTIIYKFSNHE